MTADGPLRSVPALNTDTDTVPTSSATVSDGWPKWKYGAENEKIQLVDGDSHTKSGTRTASEHLVNVSHGFIGLIAYPGTKQLVAFTPLYNPASGHALAALPPSPPLICDLTIIIVAEDDDSRLAVPVVGQPTAAWLSQLQPEALLRLEPGVVHQRDGAEGATGPCRQCQSTSSLGDGAGQKVGAGEH